MMNLQELTKNHELLSNHCTLNIGGPADYFAEPSTEAELICVIDAARDIGLPYLVVGHGSNLLFDDSGFRGLIVKFGKKFSKISIRGNRITAQAGAWMPFVARKALNFSLSGIEHTIGIPGSFGGVVCMNAGSMRKCIGNSIISVRALDCVTGNIVQLSQSECNFDYRQSIFRQRKLLVIEATIECIIREKNIIRRDMLNILAERRKKFPLKIPNCGSVFKCDYKTYDIFGPPGRIIENLGCKNMRVGGISISKKHTNFFINDNNGTSKDFRELVSRVQLLAKENGILMKTEVIYVPSCTIRN